MNRYTTASTVTVRGAEPRTHVLHQFPYSELTDVMYSVSAERTPPYTRTVASFFSEHPLAQRVQTYSAALKLDMEKTTVKRFTDEVFTAIRHYRHYAEKPLQEK